MMDINMDRTAAKEEELTFILSSKSAFLEDLGSQPWNSIFSQNQNVHSRARIFDQIVIETLDRRAPLKKIKISQDGPFPSHLGFDKRKRKS